MIKVTGMHRARNEKLTRTCWKYPMQAPCWGPVSTYLRKNNSSPQWSTNDVFLNFIFSPESVPQFQQPYGHYNCFVCHKNNLVCQNDQDIPRNLLFTLHCRLSNTCKTLIIKHKGKKNKLLICQIFTLSGTSMLIQYIIIYQFQTSLPCVPVSITTMLFSMSEKD